jgi:outer membrane protein OmpA-like peptidoglycan-associated protein
MAVGIRAEAQEPDCTGCKDHPLLSRYPQSVLVGHDQQAFDEQRYAVGPVTVKDGEKVPPKTTSVSGKRTRLFYWAPEGRSGLEVFENYRQALAKAGLATVWTCSGDEACGPNFQNLAVEQMHLDLENTTAARQGSGDGNRSRYILTKLARPQGDVYVGVLAADLEFHTPKCAGVYVAIVEAKSMDTGMVTMDAQALDQLLIASGKAVIYGVYFDVDKAEIKPDSKAQLDEISKLLKQHEDIKLLITGHTDNQGPAEHNRELSQRRADAIVAALVRTYGIAPGRLTAQGMGASAPVASNATEDGRAKNRRVELVKL